MSDIVERLRDGSDPLDAKAIADAADAIEFYKNTALSVAENASKLLEKRDAEIERLRGQVEQLTADNEKLLMMLRGSGQPRNSQIPSTGREEP